jgi:hypothetical protein
VCVYRRERRAEKRDVEETEIFVFFYNYMTDGLACWPIRMNRLVFFTS